MCDPECTRYGDCCPDSQFYNETEQKINYELFNCSDILDIHVSIIFIYFFEQKL